MNALILEVIRSSLWKPAPVTEEPEVILADWMIVEATFNGKDKSRHFVGTNITDGRSGRVSSAIQEFDQENMTGKTRSGRVYKLVGAPGFSSDGSYVWEVWSRHNGVTHTADVSATYYDPNRVEKPKESPASEKVYLSKSDLDLDF